MHKFWEASKSEIAKYPSHYTFLGFFLWGLAVSLFSLALDKVLLAALYLTLAHLLALGTLYTGFFRRKGGGRNVLGIVVGLVILVFTLMIDALFSVAF